MKTKIICIALFFGLAGCGGGGSPSQVSEKLESTKNFRLAWDKSNDEKLMGYKLYYGSSPKRYEGFVDVGNVTEATLNLPPGKYFFAVTAYDKNKIESSFSEEVTH